MNRPYTQSGAGPGPHDPDQLAVERYRYLLRTAPPEQLEQAHEEAFASLTPDQRRMVLDALRREVEPAESRGVTEDPRELARLATRAEVRHPGTIERAFGAQSGSRGGSGTGTGGTGGLVFGGFLPTLAGAFMGTAIASVLFGSLGGFGAFGPGEAAAFEGGAGDPGSDPGAGAGDAGGRSAGGEWGNGGDGGDVGGDTGDLGDAGGFGDVGGFGDFGGGDFGGGDFGGF